MNLEEIKVRDKKWADAFTGCLGSPPLDHTAMFDRTWLIEEVERYRKLFSELQNKGGKSTIMGAHADAVWIDESNWIKE